MGNVTYFEDEETFSTASGSARGGASGSQDVSGGKRVADKSTDSDAMEVVLDGGGDRDQSSSHVDYQLYKVYISSCFSNSLLLSSLLTADDSLLT